MCTFRWHLLVCCLSNSPFVTMVLFVKYDISSSGVLSMDAQRTHQLSTALMNPPLTCYGGDPVRHSKWSQNLQRDSVPEARGSRGWFEPRRALSHRHTRHVQRDGTRKGRGTWCTPRSKHQFLYHMHVESLPVRYIRGVPTSSCKTSSGWVKVESPKSMTLIIGKPFSSLSTIKTFSGSRSRCTMLTDWHVWMTLMIWNIMLLSPPPSTETT